MPDHPSDQAKETNGGVEGPDAANLSLFSMALWGPDGPPERVFGRHDWGSCTEDNGHDTDCLGHVSSIREPVPIPPPNMLLSLDEMQAIALGYRPMDMNDKWLALMEENRLFLHRSWTGHGIYEVTFAAKEMGFMVTSARIEGDPRRKRGDFDPQDFDPIREREDLGALIVHLSGEPIPISLPVIVSSTPTPWVIHTVGPRWRGGTHGEPVLLESCYRESLARADEVDAKSVAFPALATGAHGYPLKAAARTAVAKYAPAGS